MIGKVAHFTFDAVMVSVLVAAARKASGLSELHFFFLQKSFGLK